MTAVTHSLMIAVMLLHSICGCCWHHGHEECSHQERSETSGVRASDARPQEAATCGHHGHTHAIPHDGAASDGETPGVPHDHNEPCEHGTCVYMAGKTLELSQPWTFAPGACFEYAVSVEPQSRVASRVEADLPPRSESALAACARLQVWNI